MPDRDFFKKRQKSAPPCYTRRDANMKILLIQTLLKLSFFLFKARFAEKGEHVHFVRFHPRLVKRIDAKQVAAIAQAFSKK